MDGSNETRPRERSRGRFVSILLGLFGALGGSFAQPFVNSRECFLPIHHFSTLDLVKTDLDFASRRFPCQQVSFPLRQCLDTGVQHVGGAGVLTRVHTIPYGLLELGRELDLAPPWLRERPTHIAALV